MRQLTKKDEVKTMPTVFLTHYGIILFQDALRYFEDVDYVDLFINDFGQLCISPAYHSTSDSIEITKRDIYLIECQRWKSYYKIGEYQAVWDEENEMLILTREYK